MNDDVLYDKIETYLRGDMSEADTQQFEAEIAANPELAERVEMHRFEWDGMEVILENDLRQKMAVWKEEDNALVTTPLMPMASSQQGGTVSDEKKSPLSVVKSGGAVRRLYYQWAAAASVTLLIGFGVWYLNQQSRKPDTPIIVDNGNTNKPKNDTPSVSPQPISKNTLPNQKPIDNSNIVKNNDKTKEDDKPNQPITPNKDIEKPQNIDNSIASISPEEENRYAELAQNDYGQGQPSFTTRGNNDANTFTDATKAFEQKNYKEVINLLKSTQVTDENYRGLQVLAHAYFRSKQYDNAAKTFENVVKLSGSANRQEAEWYLLRSYLGSYKKNSEAFKKLSDKIVREGERHEFFSEVNQLLQGMKK